MLPVPVDSERDAAAPAPPPSGDRLTRGEALAQVILCSSYPTQIFFTLLLAGVFGLQPIEGQPLPPAFIFAVSALDTVAVVGLIVWMMRLGGDSPRALFLGDRRTSSELTIGLLSVPLVFGGVMVLQIGITLFAPFLRNVQVHPFGDLLRSPWMVAALAVVVVVSGGLREELQRAFLLNRFERRLGGPTVGVVTTSVAFGLGHAVQGHDAAVLTALLGATWGVMYLWRRSIVSTVTCHALFNLGQLAMAYSLGLWRTDGLASLAR